MKGNYFDQIAGAVKLDSRVSVYVPSAATPEAVQEHAAEVVQLCQQIKKDMQQEGVSLDVDGTLYII